MVLIAYNYYRQEKTRIIAEKECDLHLIAGLKVEQIISWREDNTAHAKHYLNGRISPRRFINISEINQTSIYRTVL